MMNLGKVGDEATISYSAGFSVSFILRGKGIKSSHFIACGDFDFDKFWKDHKGLALGR